MDTNITKFKYIILGAGPGGLQMGYFLNKQKRNYIILEKNSTAGSFFAKNPKHRKLISINKKYNYFQEEEFNWRHDWNSLLSDDPKMRFTEYTEELFADADILHKYLQDYATKFSLKISYNTEVEKIARTSSGHFLLTTRTGSVYECEVLLMGLGSIKPMMPKEIEGVELTTCYDKQTLDLEFYKNKRVGIIGQGNSAFETAEYLSGVASFVHILAKHPIKYAWETHFVGDLRAVNNNILDMYQLKSLHAVLNPRVKRISKNKNGCLQTNHEYHYPRSDIPGTLKLTREYDIIICCAGWKWLDDKLFASDVKPDSWYKGKFPELNSSWESKNIPNMYFIGGAMQGNDRQASSGFIHGFRYNIRTLFNLLEEKFEDVAYPSKTWNHFKWNECFDWMYDRFSTSAALFQLYGVLSDVLVFSDDLKEATLYKELPLSYASEQSFGNKRMLIFTLEFGFNHFKESSLSFMGPSDPHDTKCAAFLHPVIRYRHGKQEDEFHFGDSLLGRWDRPHGDGGAVVSYHYTFQQWIEKKFGIDLDLPEPTEEGPYKKWTQQEIELWERNSMGDPMKKAYDCIRP